MSGPAYTLFRRLVPLLCLVLVISGCSVTGGSQTTQGDASPKPGGSPAAGQQPVPGSRITEGGLIEPRTLNPIFVADPVSEEISHLVFNGLVFVDPKSGEPQPDLAQSWEVSDDRLTYTFHLRDSVLWHDGQPFAANDVVFTYQLMMNNRVRSPRFSRLVERVHGVGAPDRSTVTFTLIHPDATFLTDLATFGIVPEHLLSTILPEELVTDPFGISSAVGTGPFTLQQWVRGDRILFQRNSKYFKDPAKVEGYVYRVLPSTKELLSGLKDESIDWAAIDPAGADEAKKVSGIRVESLPGYEMSYVSLQLDPAKTRLFQDVRIRKALMLALDRKQGVTDIWHGQATVADGTQPPSSFAHAPSKTVYQQNLEQAKSLLDEAGWKAEADGIRMKDGQALRFTLTTNSDDPERKETAEWLIKSWSAIGVYVDRDFQKWSTIREETIRTRDFDALLLGYRWGIDPDQTAVWSSDSFFDAFNLNHYSNDQVDQLLDKAVASGDTEERKQLYAQAQDTVMEELPSLPLFFPNETVAVSKKLTNAQVTAIFMRNRANIEQWNPPPVKK
ncbi:ABC transporter substrate-binding protein [Nitrolancea hollandica]|uniref:Extracellular solute-binding protein family 5 n=1 Tax=Nitrolancea hollandica Lb TaxID=1129897 RepID=I4EC81_9BACT|nr:ABC transporter substrate-binding protein [Nitrolancea hollandica]CCF82293.1 Extracellular solute-binding protein family 5 [Nitrolancea hollandica Lb]